MKNITKLNCLFAFLIIFYACTDREENVTSQNNNVSYFISKDSAIAISNKAIAEIANKSKTRCVKEDWGLEIKDINLINISNKPRTRANETNISTSLYIINYKDNKGFSIISSDKRLRPIYAVSDTGHIAITDTITNKSLTNFFNGVRYDIEESTKNPMLDPYANNETVIYPQVSPLIWLAPGLWGQEEPYNTYCYTKDGKKALVGCAAVACGIIMSYYSWPSYIDGQRLNWHSMKKYTVDHKIDFVFGKLGEKKQLDMNYGVNASGASSANFSRTFVRMGYNTPDNFKEFSEDNVCKLLENNSSAGYGPLLIIGNNTNGKSGHAWVIDGYCKNVTSSDGKVVYGTNLFHCIWGWKGRNNGYFFLNNGVIGGTSHIYDKDDSKTPSNSPNYYTKLYYMSNFRINRNKQNVNLK